MSQYMNFRSFARTMIHIFEIICLIYKNIIITCNVYGYRIE